MLKRFVLCLFLSCSVFFVACGEKPQTDSVDGKVETKKQVYKKPVFGRNEDKIKKKYKPSDVPEGMTVEEKKKRFRALLVPPTQKVYLELDERFYRVSNWLKEGKKAKKIAALKEEYKAETDQELLAALKPHPPSIVLAQAAMESAWGTSRFFVKAKNVFGIWSFDEDEPRIAAGETRGKKTIWLKKYKTVEDAVRDNYRVLARGHAHQHFRDARLETEDPFELVKKLDRYSEIGEKYGEELASVISYNNFTEYDPLPREQMN